MENIQENLNEIGKKIGRVFLFILVVSLIMTGMAAINLKRDFEVLLKERLAALEIIRSNHGLIIDSFSMAQALLSLSPSGEKLWQISGLTIREGEKLMLHRDLGDNEWFSLSLIAPLGKQVIIKYLPTSGFFKRIIFFGVGSSGTLALFYLLLQYLGFLKKKMKKFSEKEHQFKMLAHDLKGSIQGLEIVGLGEKDQKNLAHGYLQRMKSMSREFLKTEASLETVTLKNFTSRMEKLFTLVQFRFSPGNQEIFKNGLDYDFRVDQELLEAQGIITGNIFQIERHVENILTNAFECQKYLEISASVQMRLILLDKKLTVEVVDRGPGIPQKILKDLENGIATSTKIEGQGLGLSNSYSHFKNLGKGYEFRLLQSNAKGTWIHFIIPLLGYSMDVKNIVLVEDDELIGLCWRTKAQERGLKLDYYSDPNDFYLEHQDFSEKTIFYLDGYFKGKNHLSELISFIQNRGGKNIFSLSQTSGNQGAISIPQLGKNEAYLALFS